MSSSPANPDHHGAFSNENIPPVFVRAGKVFACTSCGVMVEIPADVVGKLAWRGERTTLDQLNCKPPAPQAKANQQPPREQPATSQQADTQTSRHQVTSSTSTATEKPRPARPDRPKQPQRPTFAGKRVDGLTVPSGQQLDYAIKWVSFHLKILDRQNEELKRLKKLLKKSSTQSVPCSRPHEDASSTSVPKSTATKEHVEPRHAQEDLGVAPSTGMQHADHARERAPP